MNKEVGKMRSIRRNKERIGFVILTTLLSLVFVVSIVYAAGHGGVQNNVSWYVEVNGLDYNEVLDVTKSNHSVYVWNGGGASVFVDYEFKHQVDSDPGKTLRDQGWLIRGRRRCQRWLASPRTQRRGSHLQHYRSSPPCRSGAGAWPRACASGCDGD